MNEVMQEMSLEEWCARLPESHRVNRELKALKLCNAHLESEEITRLQKLLKANRVEYRSASDIMKDAGIPNMLEGSKLTIHVPKE